MECGVGLEWKILLPPLRHFVTVFFQSVLRTICINHLLKILRFIFSPTDTETSSVGPPNLHLKKYLREKCWSVFQNKTIFHRNSYLSLSN